MKLERNCLLSFCFLEVDVYLGSRISRVTWRAEYPSNSCYSESPEQKSSTCRLRVFRQNNKIFSWKRSNNGKNNPGRFACIAYRVKSCRLHMYSVPLCLHVGNTRAKLPIVLTPHSCPNWLVTNTMFLSLTQSNSQQIYIANCGNRI